MTQFGAKDGMNYDLAEEEVYQRTEIAYFDPSFEDYSVLPAEDKLSVTITFTRLSGGPARKVIFYAPSGFLYGGWGAYVNDRDQHYVSVYFNKVQE